MKNGKIKMFSVQMTYNFKNSKNVQSLENDKKFMNAEYNMNTQKSLTFLYANKKYCEKFWEISPNIVWKCIIKYCGLKFLNAKTPMN